ncbi:MAG: hypothetical protein RR296_06050, partial [Clostridia bacterium]
MGETIKYAVVVTNEGNQTLENIALTDSLAGITEITPETDGVVYTNFALEVGQSATFTYDYVVTEADLVNEKVDNVATATVGGAAFTGSASIVTVAAEEKLGITKEITGLTDGEVFKLGDTIPYAVTVTNEGNQTLANIALTDSLEGIGAITGADGVNYRDFTLEPTASATFT